MISPKPLLVVLVLLLVGAGCGDDKTRTTKKTPPKQTTTSTNKNASARLVVDAPVAFDEVVRSTVVRGAAKGARIARVGWILIDAEKIHQQGTIDLECRQKQLPCDGTFSETIRFTAAPGNYTLDVFMLDPDDPKAQIDRQEIPLTLYDKAPPKPVGGNAPPETATPGAGGGTSTTAPPPAKLEDATG